MGARPRIDYETTHSDGSAVYLVAYDVPRSDRWPDGVRYRFQYVSRAGSAVLRYDNFPDHLNVPAHHRHLPGGRTEGVSCTDIPSHVRMFLAHVSDLRTPR